MQKDDQIRLRHMLDATDEALEFSTARSREDLDNDRMLTLALVKCIEIVGEAANQIPRAFQEQHPQIPWADIIGMRNRLIHAYYDVNLDILWRTIQDELPPLKQQLLQLLHHTQNTDGTQSVPSA